MNPTLEREVRTIYADAERDIAQAGPVCHLSGRCCRFQEYGHTLFISNLEAEILLQNAPPYVGPVSEDGCPFQRGKLCTVREHRPLGCRIYFCDPAYQETGQAISEKYIRQLKALADRYGVPWRYAPLHAFLNHELETGL
jgi:Fe-S-cluster containining protein